MLTNDKNLQIKAIITKVNAVNSKRLLEYISTLDKTEDVVGTAAYSQELFVNVKNYNEIINNPIFESLVKNFLN